MPSQTLQENLNAIQKASTFDDLIRLLLDALGDQANSEDTAVVRRDLLPETNHERPLHEGVTSLDDLFAKASIHRDAFQKSVADIAQAVGGKAVFRPGNGLKARERAEKAVETLYDGDPAKVLSRLTMGTTGTLSGGLRKGQSPC